MATTAGIHCVPADYSPEEAVRDGVDLVVVGPEVPLVRGAADRFRAAGLLVAGPSAAAASLEGSKAVAKALMDEAGIPTAEWRRCHTPQEARAAVAELGLPVVVKADGLAAGKGVAVCHTADEAASSISAIMEQRRFGAAGDTVVVERCLHGFEASVIVMVDETETLVLPTARDHKPIGEGDTGPNTGGMGAVSPNPEITPAIMDRIVDGVVNPTVAAIRARQERDGAWLFRGFLFIGLMIDDGEPYVLEYNVRFGDPEAQAILPRLDGDFGMLVHGLAAGQLREAITVSGYAVRPGASCAVVAAASGYPEEPQRGAPIAIAGTDGSRHVGGREAAGASETEMLCFAAVAANAQAAPGAEGAVPAAVAENDSPQLVTAGGRVLAAVAWGDSLEAARRAAYARLMSVSFDGMQYRRDIGGPPLTHSVLEEGSRFLPQFAKRGGVIPVVVQDVETTEVLMVGYVNERAVAITRESGWATFWSTSRNQLWTKGETSGNRLAVVEIRVDCDQDALLYRVRLEGAGVCHTTTAAGTPRYRCFYRTVGERGELLMDEAAW
jgi:phosphoribosylamine--glycine ligase